MNTQKIQSPLMEFDVTQYFFSRLRSVAILSLTVIALPINQALAEGTAQLGLNQHLLDSQAAIENNYKSDEAASSLYVDILTPGEIINVSLCGDSETDELSVAFYPPSDEWTVAHTEELSHANISCDHPLNQTLPDAYRFKTTEAGPWRVVLQNKTHRLFDQSKFRRFDISVTSDVSVDPDPTLAAGRLWAYDYSINATSFDKIDATDADLFALVPGGRAGTDFVWKLDLNKFAGFGYNIFANAIGVEAPNSSYSTPIEGNEANYEFPVYLGNPVIAQPRPTLAAVISEIGFTDSDNSDFGISPANTDGSQDFGTFLFTTDVAGTYSIRIDLDQDGVYGTEGDVTLAGRAQKGLNKITWDGNNSDHTYPDAGLYSAEISVHLGEYHFVAIDAESSGGDEQGLTIFAINERGEMEDTNVYWDDSTRLDGEGFSNLPLGARSSSPDARHTWGNFSSDGFGNERFIDTWVYGLSSSQTTVVAITDNDIPIVTQTAVLTTSGITEPGETIAISLSDDAILDPAGINVTAINTRTSEEESVRLNRTAAGLYSGSLPTTSSGDTGNPLDGALSVSSGDTVRISYTDPLDASGIPATVSTDHLTDDDNDGDGQPDSTDTDDDNDGISDTDEGNADPDQDSLPNRLDPDSDNDGLPDAIEGNADSDSDGTPDFLDLDSDGDGIEDSVEGANDNDGDSTPNYIDTDSDNDGLSDADEATGNTDVDGDGIPNYLDTDSDGDGISDADEGSGDTDNDGILDYLDNVDDSPVIEPDLTDSDNDTITDAIEDANGNDTDGDGLVDSQDTDSDGDGIPDQIEVGSDPANPLDTDGDGMPNYIDTDSDNDGLSDSIEGTNDHDGDGLPNYLDEDSDHDGIPDSVESNGDSDGDGVPDYLDVPSLDLDSDNDGIINDIEGLELDSDGDGQLDYQDTDSDNDGIPDGAEAGNTLAPVDTDLDGLPDFRDTDSDNDTIPDAVEVGTRPNNPRDTDNDGEPDWRDADSDGDGISDFIEAGMSGAQPDNRDNDSVPSYRDLDSDNDGLSDALEGIVDTDNDGVPDRLDADSDNDGLTDAAESRGFDNDMNGDGLVDDFTDTNGNGWSDAYETPMDVDDIDGDNLPDHLDLDTDNDGLFDIIEVGGVDENQDGRVDTLADTDNDGIVDSIDVNLVSGADADGDGIVDSADANFVLDDGDLDSDGITDSSDPDADGNGLADSLTDDGQTVLQWPDTDGDGVADVEQPGETPGVVDDPVTVVDPDADPGIYTGLKGGCSIGGSGGNDSSLMLLLLLALAGMARTTNGRTYTRARLGLIRAEQQRNR